MPTLSIFFGIVIRMWHDDHPPPHIHAPNGLEISPARLHEMSTIGATA